MIIVPLETKGHTQDAVVLVLSRDNLERLRQADPAEVVLRQTSHQLINPTILICYEEDDAALSKLLRGGDVRAVLEYLQRGWQFRPDRGDHDRGPEPLGRPEGTDAASD